MKFNNPKKQFIIYKRILKGLIYIGQTNGPYVSEELLKMQAGTNGSGYKGCTCFYDAIQKYGFNRVKNIVLAEDLNEKQADMLETYFIVKYNSTDPRVGYNMNRGNGFKVDKDLMEELLLTDDFELLEQLDDEPLDKNTHDINEAFVIHCVEDFIQGKKNIRREMKKWNVTESSFTHYMYRSSDPGMNRFNPEFYELWTTPERDCEGKTTGLF